MCHDCEACHADDLSTKTSHDPLSEHSTRFTTSLVSGFLEHIYIPALEHELRARGHRIAREVWVTVFFKGMVMGKQRLDMVVDEKLVVEVKSTYDLRSGALRQLHNYLCATHLQVGLFLHFGPEPKFYRMVSARPPTGSV